MHWPLHHLWLLPDAEHTRSLTAVVVDLARRLTGPEFTPHLTLLGQLSGGAATSGDAIRDMAGRLSPMLVPVRRLSTGATRFKSVYLSLGMTTALAEARAKACELPHTSETVYDPHLSLAYGGSLAERDELLRSQGVRMPESCVFDRLALVRAESEEPRDWHLELCCSLGQGRGPAILPSR